MVGVGAVAERNAPNPLHTKQVPMAKAVQVK